MNIPIEVLAVRSKLDLQKFITFCLIPEVFSTFSLIQGRTPNSLYVSEFNAPILVKVFNLRETLPDNDRQELSNWFALAEQLKGQIENLTKIVRDPKLDVRERSKYTEARNPIEYKLFKIYHQLGARYNTDIASVKLLML